MKLMSLFVAPMLISAVYTPVWAQDATKQNARYCGLGAQGAIEGFKRNNPNLAHILENPKERATINAQLFKASSSPNWQINLYSKDDQAGSGASMGLSHVLSYETVDPQPFVDPRDGKVYYNIVYSAGINTVLFDINERQIKALVPAIIVYNERLPSPPNAAQQAAAFAGMFRGIEDPESAIGMWLSSIKRLPIRHDEKNYFQVTPVVLSDEARQTIADSAKSAHQSPELFIRNLTSQYEALTAMIFGKPVVPVAVNDDGSQAQGNQYVANIPECLDQGVALILPEPSYQLRLKLDKLAMAEHQHALPSVEGVPSRGTYQTEFAYGGRYQSEIVAYDSLSGGKPLDVRTFKYQKSIRFAGARTVSPYEQYFKLTGNFMRGLLMAYATQDKNWVKENMSAVVAKKEKDPSKITKAWKSLIKDTMAITPPPPEPEEADEDGKTK